MTPRIIYLVWLLFTLPLGPVWAQLSKQDSLSTVAQNDLAYKLYLSKPDSSIAIAQQSLRIAISAGNRYLEGHSYYILSKAYWAKANFKLSAEFGFKALRIFENSSFTDLWCKSLLGLARTLIDLKDTQQGGKYITKALAIARASGSENSIGECYREKSMLLSELKQYDSALYYSNLGIAIFEKNKDSLNLSIFYSRKGKIHFYLHDYKASSAYNRKALLFDSLIGNKRALGISFYQSALDAIHTNQFDSAIMLLRKSIPVNKDMQNRAALVKVHNLLADIYIEQKRFNLAVKELKAASQYKDSLYNAEKTGQIQEMQSLYDLASKEKTIQALEHDNASKQDQVQIQRLVLAILVLSLILFALIIFFLIRYKGLQERSNVELFKKNQAIEQQKEEIQAQAESLQQLNDLKSKLFSVISHDLRGPMATLHALLDLLSKKQLTPDEFVMVSDKLRGSMDITKRTLENLLNWSLSQMEGIRTEPTILDLREVISESCHLMKDLADNKQLDIRLDVDDAIQVRADANHVQLILRNLIHNAIKFSKPSNHILISAIQKGDQCLISIKDFGIGMTAHELEKVISVKQHFSKRGTQQEKGTGLGLLLCREFVKLNGGDLSIMSKSDEGTEVTFTLPMSLQLKSVKQVEFV